MRPSLPILAQFSSLGSQWNQPVKPVGEGAQSGKKVSLNCGLFFAGFRFPGCKENHSVQAVPFFPPAFHSCLWNQETCRPRQLLCACVLVQSSKDLDFSNLEKPTLIFLPEKMG